MDTPLQPVFGTPLDLPVLALVNDMIFSSKISATARAAGTPIRIIARPAGLLVGTAAVPGRLLIVDLNLDGAIDAAAAWGKSTGKPTIGFVSHVDKTAIDYARKAGIDTVLARSEFVTQLESLLTAIPR